MSAEVHGAGHGKAILLGEHAVVEGAPALVSALPDGVRATVIADAPALVVEVPEWTLRVDTSQGSASASEEDALARDALLALTRAMVEAGLPEAAIQLVPTRERAAVTEMLHMVEHIDVIVPRGGKGRGGMGQGEDRVPAFGQLEGRVHVHLEQGAAPEIREADVGVYDREILSLAGGEGAVVIGAEALRGLIAQTFQR